MASFSVSNGNTTVKFEYTTPSAKMQSVVGDCAHYLFDLGYGNHGTEEAPILFTSLTNQQKLNIVDAHIKQVVLDTANTYKSQLAQTLARETEEANEHSL